MYRDASAGPLTRASFGQPYPGAGSIISGSNTVKNDPLFADPRHTTSGPTAGTGDGIYTL